MRQTTYKGKSVEPKGSTYGAKKPIGKNLESKNSKQQMGKKKDVAGEKAPSKNTDMVTLTQAEFDTIMETLGKLAIESGITHNVLGLPNTINIAFMAVLCAILVVYGDGRLSGSTIFAMQSLGCVGSYLTLVTA